MKEGQVARLDTNALAFAVEKGRKLARNKKASARAKGVRYSTDDSPSKVISVNGEAIVALNPDSSIQQRLSEATPQERGKIVEDYLRSAIAKQGSYTFHDGTVAIMDNSDISKIGHTKYEVKNRTAVSMDDIVRVARLYAQDSNIEHSKFNFFKYYSAKVKIGDDIYSFVVNVGRGKYDNTYHIYDINQFGNVNRSGNPVLSNPRKSVEQTVSRATTPAHSVPQNTPVVKPSAQKNIRRASRSGRTGKVKVSEGLAIYELSDRQYAAYKAGEIMARALGTDIVFHKELGVTANGKSVNGYYDPQTGELHININAKRDGEQIALYTLGHETTHYLYDHAPGSYRALEAFVAERMGEKFDVAVREKLAELKQARMISKSTPAAEAEALAREEVVADGMEGVLADGEVLTSLAAENATLWEKIKTFVLEAIHKIKSAYASLRGTSKAAQVLAETMDALDGVKQLFYEGVVDASEARKSAQAEGVTRMNSEKMQVRASKGQDQTITVGMSDSERAEILRTKEIVAPVYEGQIDEQTLSNPNMQIKFQDMDRKTRQFVKTTLEKIATDFGVLDVAYRIEDIDVQITLSKRGMSESISKDATPEKLAKMLPMLKETVENAIGIETHANRYYYDSYTISFQNLLGGYIDGDTFVPVRFGLKHGQKGEATLYVIVDQDGISRELLKEKKQAEVLTQAPPTLSKPSNARSTCTYSITQIIPFVNSEDVLRYLPDDMLTEKQRNIKYQQIAETIEYTKIKNDNHYKKFIFEGKLDAAKQMVKAAAKANGYEFYPSETGKDGVWIHPVTGQVKSGDAITYDDNDNVIPISKRFDVANDDRRYSVSDDITESVTRHAERAVEVFGLTSDLSRAGFVLPSGQMPNLSEYGLPGVQHKRIEAVFEDADARDPVNRFIQEGNVRLNASAPGIELAADIPPTVAQYNVISKLVSRGMRDKGVFYVDVVDSQGGIVDSVTYDTRDDAQSIIYDLKTYYRRGVLPQSESAYRSGIRYSVGEESKDATQLSEKDLRILLDDAQNGVLANASYIPLRRNTPGFFIEVVREHSEGRQHIEDYPVAATVEHLRQNMEEDDGKSYGEHRPTVCLLMTLLLFQGKWEILCISFCNETGDTQRLFRFIINETRRLLSLLTWRIARPIPPKITNILNI